MKKFAGVAVLCLCFLFAAGLAQDSKPAFTTFDAPGAGAGFNQGTIPDGINDSGVIVGHYVDATGVSHGFRRSAQGSIATGDVPGAGHGSGEGTVPFFINATGEITGYYIDSGRVAHGFVRLP